MKILLAIALGAAVIVPMGAYSAPIEDTRVKIATSSHRENGCSESSRGFKVVIPNAEKLDRDYKGLLGGIEVVIRERNGTASYSNFAFADDGQAVIYQLQARGAGTRLRMPWGNGNVCHRAEGANIAIDVYGHYKVSNN